MLSHRWNSGPARFGYPGAAAATPVRLAGSAFEAAHSVAVMARGVDSDPDDDRCEGSCGTDEVRAACGRFVRQGGRSTEDEEK
ncbi:hypothetical protein ACQP0C_36445 [Nocardia sp. CA-129566]|uniref:hypothetical protein n=1 Tax=Nocardia sp. CA-129566 TaxID=3239976 RepID=UPI003D956DA0